jgi:2'-5' RNA ligase
MRLFIALELPATDHERIHRVVHPLRTRDLPIRWVDPDAYHLTLKFLGDVSTERLPELERAMRDATAGLTLTSVAPLGVGGAPSLARPRVLWIDVEQSPALMQLQSRLDATLARLGFASEARPFRPHITLGRIRGGQSISPADLDALRELAAELDFGSGVATDAPNRNPTSPRTPGRPPTPTPTPPPTSPIATPSLALIESRLAPAPDGARYRVLSRIPLSSPEGPARE